MAGDKITDKIWQSAQLSQLFLESLRGAVPLAAEQIDVLLRILRVAKPQLNSFLDLGCGDGILGHALLREYPQAQGLFCDFSAPMLVAARKRLADFSGRTTFIDADYGERGWVVALRPHAPFDVIVSGFSIHHQPDPRTRALYAEIYELLAAGGWFLNLEHVNSVSGLLRRVYDELFIDSLYASYQRRGIEKLRHDVDWEYHNRVDREANMLAPDAVQLDWLREIGFTHVDTYFKLLELALFGGMKPDV